MQCHADINECAVDNAGCQQVCTNTPGSYVCNDSYIRMLEVEECNILTLRNI